MTTTLIRLVVTAGAFIAAPLVAFAQPINAEDGVVQVRARVNGPDLIRTARQHIGVRYVFGGSTPRAFDCSGFVRYVFAQHGLRLPRTAKEQAGLGNAPVPGDLQPGDLLFFYGGRGASHIALYVGGDTIIHASSSAKRVRLDRFSGERTRPTWFGKRLIAVRRVLPAEGVFSLPLSPAQRRSRWGSVVDAAMMLTAPPVVY